MDVKSPRSEVQSTATPVEEIKIWELMTNFDHIKLLKNIMGI
jgi:hypothetical protein